MAVKLWFRLPLVTNLQKLKLKVEIEYSISNTLERVGHFNLGHIKNFDVTSSNAGTEEGFGLALNFLIIFMNFIFAFQILKFVCLDKFRKLVIKFIHSMQFSSLY